MPKITISKHASFNISSSARDAVIALFDGSHRICTGDEQLYLEIDELESELPVEMSRLSAILIKEGVDLSSDEFLGTVALVMY